MSEEFGLITNTHGPFETEIAAVMDALDSHAVEFITGRNESGWFWALAVDYKQLGGNKTVAVNLPEGAKG